MKNVMNNFKQYSMYLGVLFLSLGVIGCSDDDDGVVTPDPDPTGTVTVDDQTLSGNTLVLEEVTVGQDSWVLVRNEDGQQVVSDPVFVEEGTTDDVRIQLNENANLTGDTDGDDFEVVLYADNPNQGTQGDFDEGVDQPITGANQTVNTTAPHISITDDQMVTEEGEVTFTSVNTGATGGYIGLYDENDQLVGRSEYLEPGLSNDVTARFNDGFVYNAGQVVNPRLHMDDPTDRQFTYTTMDANEDLPEVYGYDQTTGEQRFVQNTGNTAAPGGFTIGNAGTVGAGAGTGTGTGAGAGAQ